MALIIYVYFESVLTRYKCVIYNLLSYYLVNKWSFHIRSQSVEILTLIGEK